MNAVLLTLPGAGVTYNVIYLVFIEIISLVVVYIFFLAIILTIFHNFIIDCKELLHS